MAAPTFVPDELVTASKMNELPKGILGYATEDGEPVGDHR